MQGLPSISSVDLGPWQSFYTALAATSATLAGLLFVALSFNLELLGRAEHEHTHRTASHAFATFLYVLLIALVLLMPHATRAELVVTLAVVGLVGLGGAIALWWQTRRGASRSLRCNGVGTYSSPCACWKLRAPSHLRPRPETWSSSAGWTLRRPQQ
jgi:hypothetical protein